MKGPAHTGIHEQNLSENTNKIKTIHEFLKQPQSTSLRLGVLCLLSALIGFVLPMGIVYFEFRGVVGSNARNYAEKAVLLISNMVRDWPWLVVLFLLAMVYAVGDIFFRSDIDHVDRKCFKRKKKEHFEKQIKPLLVSGPSCLHPLRAFPGFRPFYGIKEDRAADFCRNYCKLLIDHLKTNNIRWPDQGRNNVKEVNRLSLWLKASEECQENCDDISAQKSRNNLIDCLNYVTHQLHQCQKKDKPLPSVNMIIEDFFSIYPPGPVADEQHEPQKRKRLQEQQKQQKIIKPFLKGFLVVNEDKTGMEDGYLLAAGWYFLLYLRSEIACGNEEECQFPYQYYDAYLTKRESGDLWRHATWCKTRDTRTKDVIDELKIEIRMHKKIDYGMIEKDEADNQMASSAYTVASLFFRLSFFSMGVLVLLVWKLFRREWNGEWNWDNSMSLFITLMYVLGPPVVIFLLHWSKKTHIMKSLHSQRLQEILHVLKVYDEYKKMGEEKNTKRGKSAP